METIYKFTRTVEAVLDYLEKAGEQDKWQSFGEIQTHIKCTDNDIKAALQTCTAWQDYRLSTRQFKEAKKYLLKKKQVKYYEEKLKHV